MATLHLIVGLPCSGKTTYANGLRVDANCVLFSLDRWLITMFGRYELAQVGHDEHTKRVLACRELVWDSTSELLRRSIDVVLDDGFFLRYHRVRHVSLAGTVGAAAKIHHLERYATSDAGLRYVRIPRFPYVVLFDILGSDLVFLTCNCFS